MKAISEKYRIKEDQNEIDPNNKAGALFSEIETAV